MKYLLKTLIVKIFSNGNNFLFKIAKKVLFSYLVFCFIGTSLLDGLLSNLLLLTNSFQG